VTSTRRLTGRIQVPLPPEEAFRLFTPRGEQDWVHGWRPHFPAPASVTCSRVALDTEIAGHRGAWPRKAGRFACYAPVSGCCEPAVSVIAGHQGRISPILTRSNLAGAS
jgi:hypothetical protein